MISVFEIILMIVINESLRKPISRLASKALVFCQYSLTPGSSEISCVNCSFNIVSSVLSPLILGWFLLQTNIVSAVLNGEHIIERLLTGAVAMTKSAFL